MNSDEKIIAVPCNVWNVNDLNTCRQNRSKYQKMLEECRASHMIMFHQILLGCLTTNVPIIKMDIRDSDFFECMYKENGNNTASALGFFIKIF